MFWDSAWSDGVSTTADFTDLTEIPGNVFFSSFSSTIETMNFLALTTIDGDLQVLNLPAIVAMLLPALTNITGSIIFAGGTAALTTFTLGSGLLEVGGDVDFANCPLDQASVDNLLIALAALDGTHGTTLYTGHEVTLGGTSASPTGAGLTARDDLIAAGNSVSTN